MQAHPEHEENDADFGQLAGHFGIGDEPCRIGSEHDPGDEIAEQGRQPQPVGEETEGAGNHESRR